MRYLLALVGIFILVGTSFGAAPNDGSDPFWVSTGHDLSHPDSRSCNILYCPADDDNTVFRNDLAGLTGGVVDYFDARTETPSMDLLMQYDYVFTFYGAGCQDIPLQHAECFWSGRQRPLLIISQQFDFPGFGSRSQVCN